MTDTQTDDDIIEIRSSNNRPTTVSNSSIATSRRPMFIETELRTDTVTTRRMAAAAANRSVQDVLDNTKSPMQDYQSTTYTYAQTTSYVPSSHTTASEAPVMARRDLHDENQGGAASKLASILSVPSQVFSAVRSQLSNGYGAVRNGLSYLTGYNQDAATAASTDSSTDHAAGGSRTARSSSQSSASGSRATGYNLRSRPVHSHENDAEQTAHHRKLATRHKKDNQNQEEGEEEDGEHQERKPSTKCLQHAMCCSKKLLQLPINIVKTAWSKMKSLPLWLLIPLLIFVALYALPLLACKPFERYHHATVNDACQKLDHHSKHLPMEAYNFVRRHTFDCGTHFVKRGFQLASDVKDSVLSSLNDIYNFMTKSILNSTSFVKNRVAGVFRRASDSTITTHDAGIEKIKSLIEELKQEREKLMGQRSGLSPDQEKEFVEIARKMIDEYAADDIGQADYALGANGGQVVDVRCQEYTDEPRQNVVKFLGIPIVHMSKQPEIILKHGRMPGQCFPFKGDHGSLVIRLAVPVILTEFVMEHLPKSISIVGHTNSAPNNFTIYALKDKHDKEGVVLGRYYYDAENGPAIQKFKPQYSHLTVVEFIEIQITSNWGNPAYTCLYRFRVHGDLQSVSPTAT